jgi:SAM-dependent methyltransferase
MATPPSPFATPLAWNLVASGYADETLDHFTGYAADALALAGVGPGERVVDVAAGPGSLSLQAAARARDVAALDFSVEMLAELRARMQTRGLTNVDAVEGDGQALPYEDARFDAAFSMFGLMFFPDRARGFAELHRVLRPGGRAVVSSWQPMPRASLLTTVFEALAAELPHLPFGDGKGPLSDPEDFRREMSAPGFTVTVEPSVHAREWPTAGAFLTTLRRSLAPLVLLEHNMGAEAFAPVIAGIERRLRERCPGVARVEMPAWLALGRRSA